MKVFFCMCRRHDMLFFTLGLSFILSIITPLSAYSQAGSLDLGFDSDGMTTTSFSIAPASGYAIAIQSDGKILLAGTTYVSLNYDFGVTRFNANGSLDVSFDTDGKVTTGFSTNQDYAYAVAVQSDGKILVAGRSFDGAINEFALVRYNSNGSLDTTFDGDGMVTTALSGSDANAYSMTIQSDGKILVAGSDLTSNYNFALVRYNTDGSLDNTFDTDGIVTTDFATGTDVANSVMLQGDGKILVGGYADAGSFDLDFAIARYNTNGSLDVTFSTDGKTTTGVAGNVDAGKSIGIQSDGKIVLTGYTNPGFDYDLAVVRYNTNGSLDNTFSTDGIVTNNIGGLADYGNAVAIQSDGKILVGGTIDHPSNDDFVVVCYNANGSLDNSFDSDGVAFADFGSEDDYGQTMALQSDGKIVVGGAADFGGVSKFGIARFIGGLIGIAENDFGYNLSVYPIPSNGQIMLSSQVDLNNATLKIVDVTGKLIWEKLHTNGTMVAIDITHQVNGVYFLEVIENDQSAVIKLIKE